MDGAAKEPLAERMNAEPAIFKGCSSSELGVIVVVAALLWLPGSLLVAGVLGALTMGFGVAGVGVVATVLALAALFQRLKRNRPDGYYQQWFAIWLHDRGLRRSTLVRRGGDWDLGRTADGPLPPRHR